MDLDPEEQDLFSNDQGSAHICFLPIHHFSVLVFTHLLSNLFQKPNGSPFSQSLTVSSLFSHVLRYQQEETKTAILRMEQSAHAYTQRAIASHGAFAVLYGRYSKHYIKKSEVLLGRGTEDTSVDIDLSREGRANKISRRQAIISLDESGCFHLKNVGKFSISVNDKEITHGQSLNLTPSCLIEIRGKPFVFEINQSCVKRHLNRATTKELK
ncbi:unnamed protein product [Linum tenue]|uniref:FHA domain-containing protein n=1 Tax=Linum tenue TaxID=586396 RepID=A0AAV0LNV3_9ROSI|nr:unnamed protein product [Linum tenue]